MKIKMVITNVRIKKLNNKMIHESRKLFKKMEGSSVWSSDPMLTRKTLRADLKFIKLEFISQGFNKR
jgi:hypothetical protein